MTQAIPSKQDMLLASLRKFYSSESNLRALTQLLAHQRHDAQEPSHHLSLRILDWLVTNYAKKHNIVYLVASEGAPKTFNMFLEYKSQLKAYSKRFFDPFCRRERLEFGDADGRPFHTTVGQLNFFRWAIQNEVVRYGLANGQSIEEDMLHSIKHRQRPEAAPAAEDQQRGAGERPKRRELSKAAIKGCTKTHVRVTVRFT